MHTASDPHTQALEQKHNTAPALGLMGGRSAGKASSRSRCSRIAWGRNVLFRVPSRDRRARCSLGTDNGAA